MVRIAVIMFPGTNDDENSARACRAVGMEADILRWNSNPKILDNYDGYIIPGGFSYEDRIRAGVIAAKDPIMLKIKDEAKKGKVVLGTCNGAQILIESGLIPGLKKDNISPDNKQDKLLMALAPNINPKIKGYYCTWVYIKSNKLKRTAFNLGVDEITKIPIAHGEGRFISKDQSVIDQLEKNCQILFKYCDSQGNIINKFPINPNGAANNIAAVCNNEGNVMAIMPHPERATWKRQLRQFDHTLSCASNTGEDELGPGSKIFESIKRWISNK